VSRCSVRGYQAALCVHVDTQSGGFDGDEANFALQTRVECRAAEAGLVLVRWQERDAVIISIVFAVFKC
jgi:hypothetical protein